ncbi:MAG TPA: caspase family protein [Saprospiraceae bacterium]|nr:caspase family protein [Saprospiraceae bacterium]HMQ82986.1 caspase family protein [Saprospiraceae bacterium]
MMLKSLSIFGFFVLPLALCGQTPDLYSDIDQEVFWGTGVKEWINAMAFSADGNIFAVGGASRGVNGGSDIILLELDGQLNKIQERYLGRSGDDMANQIIRRSDSGFLLAGYSSMPVSNTRIRQRYYGKKDGWLLWLDEHGHTEAELILGEEQDDEITDVLNLPNGDWLAVGTSGSQAWLVRVNQAHQVVWQKRIPHRQSKASIFSAALLHKEEVYLCGQAGEAEDGALWVLACTVDGQMLWEKTYPRHHCSSGRKIIPAGKNRLLVVGESYTGQNRSQGCWMMMDRNGESIQTLLFGGREQDRFLTAARDYTGAWLLLGESWSFERGARQPKAWAVTLDPDGQFIEQQYYGSKYYDEGRALLQMADGSWLMAGLSGKKILSGLQAWIWKASGKTKTAPKQLDIWIEDVEYTNILFPDSDHKQGKPLLPVRIRSESESGLPAIKAVIRHATSEETWEHLLPAIGGEEEKRLFCPIPVPEQRNQSVESFEVQFFSQDVALSAPFPFEAIFDPKRKPNILIEAKHDELFLTKGDAHKIDVTISNVGDDIAQNLKILTNSENCLVTQEEVYLGNLPPGSRLHYELSVMAAACDKDMDKLHLRVLNENFTLAGETEVLVSLLAPGVLPSKEAHSNQPASTFVTWLYPNPDHFSQPTIVWNASEITIQVKASSDQVLRKEHFCLEINGQPCQQGAKFEEVQMKGNDKSKTFTQEVTLQEGENRLKAIIQSKNSRLETEELHIIYTPSQPNLHLLAIGVPSYDLKFTAQDAKDFAQFFTNINPGTAPAFQHIFLDTLTSEHSTTKTAMLKSLRRIQYRHADHQISSNDLLVLFISSHGLSGPDGRFRIAASDYDSPFLEETSLDFETEIMNYLRSLPCKKLVFIDACHSGAAGSPIPSEEALMSSQVLSEWVMEHGRDMNMILSCRSDEFSYEDDKWQNGAFTEAIAATIRTFQDNPALVDLNQDEALDLLELYGFLQQKTTELVSSKKPKPKLGQHPVMNTTSKSEGIVLFRKAN